MDERSRFADEAVRRYIVALREIHGRFFDECPGLGGVEGLLAAVRSTMTMPREGRTPSGIEYLVHGAGCRMIDPLGREVDVDLVADRVEAFDLYRIRWFLYSGEAGPLSQDDLLDACDRLVGHGELVRAGSRWFALPLDPKSGEDLAR